MHRLVERGRRETGDHLVRVHVRRRARAGLEDVDREVRRRASPARDLVGRGRDRVADRLRHLRTSRSRRSPRGFRLDHRRARGSTRALDRHTRRSGSSRPPVGSARPSARPRGRAPHPSSRARRGSPPSASPSGIGTSQGTVFAWCRVRLSGHAAARRRRHAVPAAHERLRHRRSRPAAAGSSQVDPEALTLLTKPGDARHRAPAAARAPRAARARSSTIPRRRPTTASSRSSC